MGLFGWGFLSTTAYFAAGMALHALVWNALHPNMHGLHDVPSARGAPSSWLKALRGGAYFNYLYDNHRGHHISGGRTNYNVACPLVDHLVGSYETKAVWTVTMLQKAENAAKNSGGKDAELATEPVLV